MQKKYLKAVQSFIRKDLIDGIRISARPDQIDRDILKVLKKYNVRCIELGVQSLSDSVLEKARRGHTAADVRMASRLILEGGFTLGHQIMVGLPGSRSLDELKTARISIAMGATEVRIYPVIVIKGTELAAMWEKDAYNPLAEIAAIRRSARLVALFRKSGVRVLRCGLHPSEGLLSGKDILAGPFHQAFGQKVESYLYGDMLKKFLKKEKSPHSIWGIHFNPSDAASVIGYLRENAAYTESKLKREGMFKSSKSAPKGSIIAVYAGGRKKIIGRL